MPWAGGAVYTARTQGKWEGCLHFNSLPHSTMTQVEKRWPESSYTFYFQGKSSKRVACRSEAMRLAMGEIPSHLTADTVSCKQLPASRLVPHASAKVESSFFRANVSLRVS